mmetsp:Transcript_22162/g.49017  ORF Transcript_22162/g.49017 Transcript_22162/m.49017 type:complete len:472 (+) Transcript_22162:2-1417(+)
MAHDDGSMPLDPLATVVENLFCTYFTMEVIVRFLAFRAKCTLCPCLFDAWFVFDAVLVLLMVMETWVLPLISLMANSGSGRGALSNFSSFRLLRLLRLTRMVRIMRYFPELMTLVKGIKNAVSVVFWIIAFLILVMYVFAIMFTSQLGDPNDKEPAEGDEKSGVHYFASIGDSMMTLFTNGVLGDNLIQTLVIIKADSLFLFWSFLIFMCISSLTLLNMLIGVLCQVVGDTADAEGEANQIALLQMSLSDAFEKIDVSKDGIISEEEWSHMKNLKDVRAAFGNLGVDEDRMDERLDQMQETLFWKSGKRGEGQRVGLSFDDFVKKVVGLRWDTPASALDLEVTKNDVVTVGKELGKQLDSVESQVADLLGEPRPSEERSYIVNASAHHRQQQHKDSASNSGAAVPLLAQPRDGRGTSPAFLKEVPQEVFDSNARATLAVGAQAIQRKPTPPAFLKEVPTEILFHLLKMRAS